MTEDQRNTGVLVLMTGVASGVKIQVIGAITVPHWAGVGCVKGAGGVGSLISTKLCCEEDNLASRGLLVGWAGTGGGTEVLHSPGPGLG